MLDLCVSYNPLFTGKDELVGGVSTNNNSTSTIFYAFTPALSQVFAPAQVPTPAPGPSSRYRDKNLQRAIKLALKLFV